MKIVIRDTLHDRNNKHNKQAKKQQKSNRLEKQKTYEQSISKT